MPGFLFLLNHLNESDFRIRIGGGGGGGGHFFSHQTIFFFNFIIKRVNIHGVAPSPILWEHVKERKITKFGVIGTVRPHPPPIRIFIILESFYFSVLFFCRSQSLSPSSCWSRVYTSWSPLFWTE